MIWAESSFNKTPHALRAGGGVMVGAIAGPIGAVIGGAIVMGISTAVAVSNENTAVKKFNNSRV